MIKRITRRWSLITKFLMTLIIVVMVPIVILGSVSYLRSAYLLENQVDDLLSQIADEVNHNIDTIVADYDYLLVRMLGKNEVRDFIKTDPEDYLARIEFANWLETSISTDFFLKNPYALNIQLFGKNGVSYSSDGNKKMRDYSFYDPILPMDGTLSIFSLTGEEADTIALARRVYSGNQSVGVMILNIKRQELNRIWDNVNMRGADIFIIDKDGHVLYRPEHMDGEESAESSPNMRSAEKVESPHHIRAADEEVRQLAELGQSAKMHSKKSFAADAFGKNSLYVMRRSEVTGWSMLIGMDKNVSMESVYSFRTFLVELVLVMILFSAAAGYFFFRLILRPLKTLHQNMKQLGNGNWTQFKHIETEDEIGELMRGYNRTVSEIEHLIEKVQENEKQQYLDYIMLQKAELQALQSQINPHFLYNTLGTINAYAMADAAEDVQAIVDSLSRMFRYATRNSLQPVRFAEEIEHARDFLMIQSYRLKRMPEIIWKVDGVSDRQILRLVLQPLIENAFKHGFRNGVAEDSYICIQAYVEAEFFIVRVEDNGAGPELEVKELKIPAGLEEGSIGLTNVGRRIQIIYGEQYGVYMNGAPGKGASFRLVMPKEIPSAESHAPLHWSDMTEHVND